MSCGLTRASSIRLITRGPVAWLRRSLSPARSTEMCHLARASAVVLFSLVVLPTSAQKGGETDATLAGAADAYLKTELSSTRIPGMAVCVVRRGNVVLVKGYGFANMEVSVPVSERTIF